MCRTDCIKVTNLKKGLQSDMIKIAFMNKKFSKGEVTLVTRDASNETMAFVYFSSYKGKLFVYRYLKVFHLNTFLYFNS